MQASVHKNGESGENHFIYGMIDVCSLQKKSTMPQNSHQSRHRSSETISYRLQHYDYQEALKQARKARCKSIHEYARLTLISALEEDPKADNKQMLEELLRLRQETDHLREEVSNLHLTLAKTLQIILSLNGYESDEAEKFVKTHILESL